MKKITKIVAGVAALAALSASAFSFTACGDDSSKLSGSAELYGATHSYSTEVLYAGYVSIKVDDSKVTDLTLTEVCTPMDIKFTGTSTESEAKAKEAAVSGAAGTVDDYGFEVSSSTDATTNVTTYSVTGRYKVVTYGNVTLTFNEEKKTYYVDDNTSIVQYFRDDAKVKEYYQAVQANNVSVKIGTTTNKELLTFKTLSKDENSYWRGTGDNNYGSSIAEADRTEYSRWQLNRDATVKYVLENGVDNIFNLKKSDDAVTDTYGKKSYYWSDGTVTTGATWNDMNQTPTKSAGYYSYAELINKAYYEAVGTTYQGEYSYTNYGTNYGVKVEVSVKNGKILNVAILPSDLVQLSPANAEYGWTEAMRTEYLNNEISLLKAYVGKSVTEIQSATASIKGVADAETNSVSISDLKIGASQSSARLLLAVQNALKDVK
jgi:flavin-binding protein dodecin